MKHQGNTTENIEKAMKNIETKTMKNVNSATPCQELSGCVQNCLGRSLDGSNMASRALKTAPRRPGELPRRLLNGSRTAPGPPKTPPGPPPARPTHPQGSPRASKTAQGASKAPPRALQKRFLRPQVASKSSPEEPSKPPALGLQPLAYLLLLRFMGQQVAWAGCAKR